jgi:hypothetical protein
VVTAPSGLASLVARGALDAELASLVWLLVEARVPAVIAGPRGVARDDLVEALPALLPAGTRVVEPAADDDFAWLPEAVELGWRRTTPTGTMPGAPAPARPDPATTVILARDLAGDGPDATDGDRARVVVRALALGYGLVAGIDGPDLEGVFARLRVPPVGADEDETSRLGLVLAVGDVARGPRVLAAHYVRPLARDQHGHVQRLPPAVLATWNMTTDAFDHFAWGISPELAARIGGSPVELEREQARRAAALVAPPRTGDPAGA